MQRWITAVLVTMMLFGGSLAADAQSLVGGGLTALPTQGFGPSLVTNGGFESMSGSLPAGWSGDSSWAVDQTTSHSGSFSWRWNGGNTGTQTFTMAPGTYRLSGWVRTSGVSSAGIRLTLDFRVGGINEWVPSSSFTGTNGWTYVELPGIVVPDTRTAQVKLDNPFGASGTAWFDDVKLEPVSNGTVTAFMRYPNYRGMLFDDQPMTLQFSGKVTPPVNDFARYKVRATLKDESSGSVVATQDYAAAATFNASLDGSAMQTGRSYLVTFSLIDGSSGGSVGSYPPYRVSKVPASARSTMNISFDAKNRILVHGTPRFVLGVYDSGTNYGTTDSYWESLLWDPSGSGRRLGNTKLNFYLNYWYGTADATSMRSLMDNLQKHGVMWIQTANCFSQYPADNTFSVNNSDAFVQSVGSHAGLGGYYVADECIPAMLQGVFSQDLRVRQLDPDSMNFAALLPDNTASLWPDAVDVLATDPYPMFGAEPSGGYPMYQVADAAVLEKNAVQDARPYLTVLQFFKFGSQGRFPTLAEMRGHAYMAIVEGTKGLFWWSIGNGSGALDTVCSGWCAEKTGYMSNLTSVINELAALEPVLLADDVPGALTGNTNPSAIKTKVKVVDGKGYVFAYNYTNSSVNTTFTWQTAPGSISVNAENRTLSASGSSFSDSFGPYAAHVYVLANGGAGGTTSGGTGGTGGGTGGGTTALTVGFTNPAAGATVSGSTTVTMTATGGTSYTYKLAVDGTPVYTGTNATFSWNTTAVADGSHTLTATVTDVGGASGTATRTVTVANGTAGSGGGTGGTGGTSGPPTATGTLAVFITSPLSGNTLTGSSFVNAWVEQQQGTANQFQLWAGNTLLTTDTVSNTHETYTWDTTKLPDGPITLTAYVKDATGNTGSTSVNVTLKNGNTTPPPPPTTPLTAAFTAPTSGATVTGATNVAMTASGGATSTTTTASATTLLASATTTGNTFTLAVDGSVVSTQTVSGTTVTYAWDTTKATDGSHTLALTVKDTAGATASTTQTVSVSNTVTPPPGGTGGTGGTSGPPTATGTLAVFITSPLSGNTLTGSSFVNAWVEQQQGTANQFQLWAGNTLLTTDTVSNTHETYTWDTTKLPDGPITLTAYVKDATGNTGSTSVQVTLKNGTTTTPPPAAVTAAFTAPASGATVSGTATVGMSAGGGTGTYTYTLAIDGTTVSPVTASGTTATYAWDTTKAANGSHTLALTVTDGAGATATATRTVTVSNTVTPPPTSGLNVFITSPANNATVSGRTTLNVWVEQASAGTKTYTLVVDGRTIGSQTSKNVHVYFGFNTKTVPNGQHTLTVSVKDSAGKTGTASVTVTVKN